MYESESFFVYPSTDIKYLRLEMNISALVIIHLKQRLLMALKSVNVQLDIITIQLLRTLKLND